MAMPTFTMRQLLEAGVHFGHHTRRWNPKMKPYLFGVRNGVHIIDLTKTVPLLEQALQQVRQVVSNGGRVLFVGTKAAAAERVADAAKRCGQYYVNHRWLGGMITNWQTISASIKRLRELDERLKGDVVGLTKKEQLDLTRERDKLERSLGGIKEMGGTPDMLFIIDTNKEAIAVQEARKRGIPIVAVLDSNSDPDGIDYPIPGNDDAIRAVSLYCELMSGAVLDGIRAEIAASGGDVGELERAAGRGSSCCRHPRALAPRQRRPSRPAPSATNDRGRVGRPAPIAPTGARTEQDMAEITASLVKELREKTGAGMMDCKKALGEVAGRSREGGRLAAHQGPVGRRQEGRPRRGRRPGRRRRQRQPRRRGRGQRRDRLRRPQRAVPEVRRRPPPSSRSTMAATWPRSRRRRYPGSGRDVQGELTNLIATIGENMSLRRAGIALGLRRRRRRPTCTTRWRPISARSACWWRSNRPATRPSSRALAKQLAMHVAAANPQSLTVADLDKAAIERERAVLAEKAGQSGKAADIIAKMVEGGLRKFHQEVVLLEQAFVIDGKTKVSKVVDDAAKQVGAPVRLAGFLRFALGEGIEKKSEDFAAEVAAQLKK